jgi:hypothetical protein
MDTKEIIMSHKRPAPQASPRQPITTEQITSVITGSFENNTEIAAAHLNPDDLSHSNS